jgi:glutamine synthetase
MSKIILEYVWIDGYENTRSKIKIVDYSYLFDSDIYLLNNLYINQFPEWNCDGSSCGLAETNNSDIILKPRKIFLNPFFVNQSYLVLCDTYYKDNTPHITNNRVQCVKMFEVNQHRGFLFGMEQEYLITDKKGHPYKWTEEREKDSFSYCSAGVNCLGREISNDHLLMCLKAGVEICGTNSEVMTSQWEYQIGILDAVNVGDHLWISRYILQKVVEKYDCGVSFHPKPYGNEWSGSGLHTNVSTNEMRENGGIVYIKEACEKLSLTHKKHLEVYGTDNDKRLTGKNETCNIEQFKYGDLDRTASIRIPLNVLKSGCGYFEDRRPASNANPYLITEIMLNSLKDDNDDDTNNSSASNSDSDYSENDEE